jgi:hypothetical protein
VARFRGTVRGNRGLTSRLGTKNSGMTAVVNGWDAGIRVEAIVTPDGEDVFYIFMTGGSRGTCRERLVYETRAKGEE